jgi:hypothetical protein
MGEHRLRVIKIGYWEQYMDKGRTEKGKGQNYVDKAL